MRIIAGKYKNRVLQAPKQGTRPSLAAVREAVFNICQQTIEHACMLDLFAGTGAIGLEGLSRGAEHVTFVESSRGALTMLKRNIALLGAEKHTKIYPLDVLKALTMLEQQQERFDLIYIDPPYDLGWGERVLEKLDNLCLLKPGGTIFLEEAKCLDKQWQHLVCVSSRQIGRSQLMEFSARE